MSSLSPEVGVRVLERHCDSDAFEIRTTFVLAVRTTFDNFQTSKLIDLRPSLLLLVVLVAMLSVRG